MKKACVFALIALLVQSMLFAADMTANGGKAIYPHYLSANHDIGKIAPSYTFFTPPTNLLTSYFDYMIGSYNNLPMQNIPDEFDGGYALTYHGQRSSTGHRRVFYTIIHDNGSVEIMNEITSVQIREGYSAIDVDETTGMAFFAWHSDLDSTDPEMEIVYSYDTMVEGIPGLIVESPSILMDNPTTITMPNGSTTTDNEFLWPSVAIGPSPISGMRRAYIMGRNAVSHATYASENPYIAYADFNEVLLENGSALNWNYLHVPELDGWNSDTSIWWSPRYSLIVGNDDKIYLVGHHATYDMINSTNIIEPDIDVFIGNDYGLGMWQHYSASSILPAWNPADQNGFLYFTDSENNPVQLQWVWGESDNINAVIDTNGLIHLPGLWQMVSTDLNYWFPEFNTIKEIVFDTNSTQFSSREIYPIAGTSTDSIFWQPWDTDGNHVVDSYDPETGSPVLWRDWNFCYWDDTAVDNEMEANYNLIRITEPNELGWMACVWENSWRSRAFHADNDLQYSQYANCPEIFITVSRDFGMNWSEPLKLNSIETPQFNDIIPMFAYPSDKLKIIDDGSGHYIGRLGLLFFDDNTWGVGSINPPVGINDGGNIDFSIIDIDLGLGAQVNSGINGYVTKSDDHTPISGAIVSVGQASTMTDNNGFYSLTLVPRTYSVTVTAPGYHTQMINEVEVHNFQYTQLNIDMNFALLPVGVTTVIVNNDNNSAQITWIPPASNTKSMNKMKNKATREYELISYLVWRFPSYDENNSDNWAYIGTVSEATDSIIDLTWKDLRAGQYKYAVKAVYTNQMTSSPTFSGLVNRYVDASLTGVVRDTDGNPIVGAAITILDTNHQEIEYGYQETNNSGLYHFSGIHYGNYFISCYAHSYQIIQAVSLDLAANHLYNQDFVLSDSLYKPVSVTAEVDQVHLISTVLWQAPNTKDTRALRGYKVWRMKESDIVFDLALLTIFSGERGRNLYPNDFLLQ
ncbi:MAG TPA: carboxypeptidase-like regulatory domain-containing protein [Candidatus Cloacimonadota bacterium]|nr:carboxypeptidase-like regulatory domain-containing protein [Candidatus Cloacimonadota bacterium]